MASVIRQNEVMVYQCDHGHITDGYEALIKVLTTNKDGTYTARFKCGTCDKIAIVDIPDFDAFNEIIE